MKKENNQPSIAVRVICLALVGMLLLSALGTVIYYIV